MNRSLMTPRLSSLELFASALLVALGVEMQAGCGSQVTIENNGNGGGGGTGNASSSSSSSGAGNSSTVSSSSSSTTSSSSSSSTGFIPGSGVCVDPQPVIINGIDVGLDICASGAYRRREQVDCPAFPPDPNSCCGVCPDGYICDTSGEVACACVPKCIKDADCMAEQVCFCGPTGGRCISGTCATAADCAAGQECTSWDKTMGCLYLDFACTTPQDTCSGDKDCSSQLPNSFCSVQVDGHRQCQQGGCAIGRPFLVDGEARTANVEIRKDWCENSLEPNVVGLDERIREELANAWEHTARMEHASIAAFARFALELMSLGAPSELIMRTNAAMMDETNHARMAFAMVSVYRGKKVGPGRLAMDGAMTEGEDIASIMRRVIREGCVGETVAAVEAGEAAARANDPVVRGALETIAADESAHAELAWRTVKWALNTFGADVREAIRDEMARLRDEIDTVYETRRTAWDEVLLDHGVVTTNVRESIRRAALKQVVLPCLGAVVEEAGRSSRAVEAQLNST